MSAPLLTLDGLRARFAQRPESLVEIADHIAGRFAGLGGGYFPAPLAEAARDLLVRQPDPAALPLWGVPYVVGSNIDVVGLPTSTSMPALDFKPDSDAVIVERFRAAGALLIGKVPVSPFGLCAPAVEAVAQVAAGLAVFGIVGDQADAVCADALGSGLAVVKPTPARVFTDGLVGLAPELDGIAIIAADVESGIAARRCIGPVGIEHLMPETARLGVLGRRMSAAARDVADRLGLIAVPVDTSPFAEAAALMNDDTWLVLRLGDVAVALAEHPDLFPSHLRPRLLRALRCSALDLARMQRHFWSLARRIEATFAGFDMLFIPPEADLAGFIGACGLAAIALPGVGTLVGASGSDDRLAAAAAILTASHLLGSVRPIDILASSPLAHR